MNFVLECIGVRNSGGRELALDLMTRLAGHGEHRLTLIAPDMDDYRAIPGPNIRKILCAREAGLLGRELLLQRTVPNICREQNARALLCLGNFLPRHAPCPRVVLLQNSRIVCRDPVAERRLTPRERLIIAYGRHIYRKLPKDVTVITQTPIMKRHLCEGFGVEPARVAVIPNAFSSEKLGDGRTLPPPATGGRAKPFTFLCLSRYYAHKNIDIIPDALEKLPKYTSSPAECVITIDAAQHPGARRLLERLARSNHSGAVRNIGPVPSDRLAEVYRNADALLFPTLLESYSRTYLEAMHFGLPILTSDRDFAHHLCQDAAIYFDPLDADSVAQAMARVMEDAGLRRRLAENGRRVLAGVPTWDEIADMFVDILERTARGELPPQSTPQRQHASVA